MKKMMLMFICVCLIMTCLSACGCEHEYTSSVTKEPTYDAQGERTYVCDKCNKKIDLEDLKNRCKFCGTKLFDKNINWS